MHLQIFNNLTVNCKEVCSILNKEKQIIYSSYYLDCYFDYNYEQNDLKNIKNTRDLKTCHWQCTLESECNYWTFNKADKTCYLKYAINKVKANSAYTSGPKKCMTREDIQLDKGNQLSISKSIFVWIPLLHVPL